MLQYNDPRPASIRTPERPSGNLKSPETVILSPHIRCKRGHPTQPTRRHT